ncbi:hypothetical protein HK104_007637 [Borealophlyctis nickersoniae]|nr:hypothetical protein HK104_007637 [Borealophlyctis nickersoniae]
MALFTGVLTLVTVGGLAAIAWTYSSRLLSTEVNRHLNTIVLLRRQQLAHRLQDLEQALRYISSRVYINALLDQAARGEPLTEEQVRDGNEDLRQAVGTSRDFVLAEFVGLRKQVILQVANKSVSDPSRFRRLFDMQPVDDFTVAVAPVSKDFLWAISSPVYKNNSTLTTGTFHMIIRPTRILEIITDTASMLEVGQLILAKAINSTHFTSILPTIGQPSMFGQYVPFADYEPMRVAYQTNTSGIIRTTSLGSEWVVRAAYHPLGYDTQFANWYLVVEACEVSMNAPILQLRAQLAVSIVVALVCVLCLSLPFARAIVKPVEELKAVSVKLSRGELGARVPVVRTWIEDEITELRAAFNSMADQLSEQYTELDLARKQADIGNAAKSSFLATITHELRTPLNGIIGLGNLLSDTPLNPDQKELLDSINECSDGLLIIVNDVLDFSKIEAGKLDLEHKPFDLIQCINHSLYLLNLKASQKGLVLTGRIQPGTPRIVVGDVTRLRQVLINLVGNSVKFTLKGGVTLVVDSERSGPRLWRLRFRVIDTGIGIPADAMDKLFLSFSQVDASTTRNFGGTGLGLAISKRLVELMKGTIGVESEVGKGSTFYFDMLCEEADLDLEEVPSSESFTESLGEKLPLKILLAEDNHVNQKLAVRTMKKLGYDITVANNGQEAVDLFFSDPTFDLILMDMQMPVMNGLEATKLIRQNKAVNQPPIIALTANAMESDRDRCFEAGMNAHIAKPFKINVLSKTLEKFALQIVTAVTPSAMIYMGKDKYENEELIKYGWPEDVWFHVDKLSSAHVYLRLEKGQSWENIPEELLIDCAQLCKANSIEGNKKNNIVVIYTPWSNLKKTPGMETGQVTFFRNNLVKRVHVKERVNEVVNRLNKTREELIPDLAEQRVVRDREERNQNREQERKKKQEELRVQEQRRKEAELKGYGHVMKEDRMKSNKQLIEEGKSVTELEEDFM